MQERNEIFNRFLVEYQEHLKSLEQTAIKITLYNEGDKGTLIVNGTSNKTTPFEASLSIDKK